MYYAEKKAPLGINPRPYSGYLGTTPEPQVLKNIEGW